MPHDVGVLTRPLFQVVPCFCLAQRATWSRQHHDRDRVFHDPKGTIKERLEKHTVGIAAPANEFIPIKSRAARGAGASGNCSCGGVCPCCILSMSATTPPCCTWAKRGHMEMNFAYAASPSG